MTPADGGQPQDAAGGAQRADGGDQAGGDDLGVGDAAVDEDDEVAVLAAGQPVLAAQGPGEPGGDRAQDGRLGAGREQVVGEAVDADEGQGEAGAEPPRAGPTPSRRTSAARLGSPVTGSVRDELEQFGVDLGHGARG